MKNGINKKLAEPTIEAIEAELKQAHDTAIQRLKVLAKKKGFRGINEISKTIKKSSTLVSKLVRGKKEQNGKKITHHHTSRTPISYSVVLDILQKIGKPTDTKTIIKRLLQTNKQARDYKEKVGEDTFKQVFYSSVSYLVKKGEIARKFISHNYYEYSLTQKGGFKKEPRVTNIPPRNTKHIKAGSPSPQIKKIGKKKKTTHAKAA